jgi:hypothetical protein
MDILIPSGELDRLDAIVSLIISNLIIIPLILGEI